MASIPQRELRNNVAEVLRRAEAGERLTITVGGRPVAELGPLSGRTKPADPVELTAMLRDTPVDGDWLRELLAEREQERAGTRDPWA